MKIAVLVSGGVDSSVALALLKEQGHDVTAFYLKIWLEDELSYLGSCPWQEDLSYVQATCAQLGVPLEVISMQREYHEQVVSYTISQIRSGYTPNPDMMCNARIKFGLFLDCIDGRLPRFDKIASGHYAQIVEQDGCYLLTQSPDPVKDQTYFLAHLSQLQLSRILFPIGHLSKDQVRALAEQFQLPAKGRKDSQGICFLGKFKFSDFVRHHVGEKPGMLVEHETGAVLGEHRGFWFYTVGQRQGIGLSGGPWYVVAKDVATNTVFISKEYYAADKSRNLFSVSSCSWLCKPPKKAHLHVKIRHGAQFHACVLALNEQGDAGSVQLDADDQGLAVGQFAVFYDGSHCLGAGVISATCVTVAVNSSDENKA